VKTAARRLSGATGARAAASVRAIRGREGGPGAVCSQRARHDAARGRLQALAGQPAGLTRLHRAAAGARRWPRARQIDAWGWDCRPRTRTLLSSVGVQCAGEVRTARAAAACVWLGVSVCPAHNEVYLTGACVRASLRSTSVAARPTSTPGCSDTLQCCPRAGPQAAQGQPRRGGAGGARRRGDAARGGEEDRVRPLAGRRPAWLLRRAHTAPPCRVLVRAGRTSGCIDRCVATGSPASGGQHGRAASPPQGPAARLHSFHLPGERCR